MVGPAGSTFVPAGMGVADMAVIVTGSAGLIGSEAVSFFCERGHSVIGVDNDMRRVFFGREASTDWNRARLEAEFESYRHASIDIRDREAVERLFRKSDVELVIHAAAQPSHDWAAKEPETDFSVNANGTLVLLEAARRSCPEAPFIFTSTNKVYGDAPNFLPLVEHETRWEIEADHRYADGIDETMSVDQCKHSLFGVSKLAADVMVQEYGRYFGMKTMVFRGGCLTGPLHSGTELHGFLAYLVTCILTGREYRIFGYKGKQVRDNIHSYDLVNAFYHAFKNPRVGEVYNMGGSRFSNISMIEAITRIEQLTGKTAVTTYVDDNRIGDHIWYVSNVDKFKKHYPGWDFAYDMDRILGDLIAGIGERS
jgi:CDP-paratose 2-epimerase